MNLLVKFGPWVMLIAMTGLYLGKRDDLAQAIEQCNTEKMASIAEAEKVAREGIQASLEGRIQDLEKLSLDAANARDIAIQARLEAENRPERVREIIRRVESENSCLSEPVDPAILDGLRSD